MTENILLFPNKNTALSVVNQLEKEFPFLKWDECNGIIITLDEEDYEDSDLSDDPVRTFLETIAFQKVIKLENAEYCLKGDTCPKKIICHPVSSGTSRYWYPFKREVLKENIRGQDEPLPILMIDEIDEASMLGRTLKANKQEGLDTRLENWKYQYLLDFYRYQWSEVKMRKKIFLDLKHNPNSKFCLGAKGLEFKNTVLKVETTNPIKFLNNLEEAIKSRFSDFARTNIDKNH